MSTSEPEYEPAPWRDRRFVIFATGNFANNLGEAAYKVALPLYVYELTGSLTTMSLLAALSPAMLLLGPWFGAAADRFGSRIFVVPGLVLQLTAAAALNLAAGADRLPVPLLFALAALVQLGGELYRTGWITGVPHMFPANAARSRSMLSTLFVASNVVGPLLVAAGLGLVGYLGLLWFNAVTFVAPIVVWLIGIHPPPVPVRTEPGQSLLRDIAEGWLVVRRTPRVLRLQLMSLPLHFASGIGVLTFLVWYLRDQARLPAETVGLVQGAVSVGALLGSLFVAARARTRPDRVLAASAVVMTAALFVMAVLPTPMFVVAMVAFFTLRSAMAAVTAMIMVKYLPAGVIGRAEGLFNLIAGLPILLAPLLIPLVQRQAGATAVLVFLGLVAAVSLLGLPGGGRRSSGGAARSGRRGRPATRPAG